MLKKLMKYDLKWHNRIMFIYFAVLIIILIPLKIVESIDVMQKSVLLVIIDKVLSSIFMGVSISCLVTCLIRTWVRFIINNYKDESYLTHTIPVSKSVLFNSKVLSAICCILMAVAIVFMCYLILFIDTEIISDIKNMYQAGVSLIGTTWTILAIIGFISILFLEAMCVYFSGIFGIVLGHSSNNHKMLKSIFSGIICYFVLATLSFIIIIIVGNIANIDLFTMTTPTVKFFKVFGITAIVVYLTYDLILYFISKRLFNKGINIE